MPAASLSWGEGRHRTEWSPASPVTHRISCTTTQGGVSLPPVVPLDTWTKDRIAHGPYRHAGASHAHTFIGMDQWDGSLDGWDGWQRGKGDMATKREEQREEESGKGGKYRTRSDPWVIILGSLSLNATPTQHTHIHIYTCTPPITRTQGSRCAPSGHCPSAFYSVRTSPPKSPRRRPSTRRLYWTRRVGRTHP